MVGRQRGARVVRVVGVREVARGALIVGVVTSWVGGRGDLLTRKGVWNSME